MNTTMDKPVLKNVFYTLSILAISTLCLIYFDGIFKTLVISLFFWYIIYDLKRKLGKIKIKGRSMPRRLSSFSAFILITLALILVLEIISVNIEQISAQGPAYKEKLNGLMQSLSGSLNDPRIVEHLNQALTKLDFGNLISGLVNSLSSFVTNFAVVLVYVIFMLLEETAVKLKSTYLFPAENENSNRIDKTIKKIDSAVRAYMNSMILISLITAAVSYLALLFLGVDFPVLWAFLVFIMNFIPYLGPFVSSLLPAVFAVFQFGDLMYFVYVFAAMEIIQIILGNFVQPKMMGKSLNISPITVLLVLAFWGGIWGIIGMILAVPLASITMIILAQFPETHFGAVIMSENGKIGEEV